MNQNEKQRDTGSPHSKSAGPRIYVASLADYNAGKLHGRWIEADQEAALIHAAIAEMLKESDQPSAEEWAIHDYECFGGISLGEYESIELIAEVAPLLVEHGEVFGRLVEHLGGLSELEDAKRHMEEGYHGSFSSLAEYAEQFVDDCYGDSMKGIPDFIRYHIDYAGIGRDFELSGDIFTIELNGKMHVFSNTY